MLVFPFRNIINKIDAYAEYVVLAALLFLIVNWLFNHSRFRITLEEGLANDGDSKSKSKSKDDGVKCPEDCTSVKELQTKLSDAIKKVQTLEASIIQNTNTGIMHSNAISDMNQSINDMKSNQKNE
jgi:hypothetical protein